MEFSEGVLLDFLLRSGGKVSNSALLEHFKPLFPEDPQGRASMRDTFKKCVDSVALVRTYDGVRHVCLKKQFRPERIGSDPEKSAKGETAMCTSSGDDAAQPPGVASPGSHSGSDVQVCVPHVSTCVSEKVRTEQRSTGQMGNRGSCRHPDRGSRKEAPVVPKPLNTPDIPAIAVIEASPVPAEEAVFNLPRPAQTGTTLPEAAGCRLTCRVQGETDSGDEAVDSGDEARLDCRDLSDEDSPKGSRKHFIQLMMNSSPDVRRSMVLRNWDPKSLWSEDASDSASLASSVEERSAVTLDPLEHEWMMCASDGEWRSLQRLLETDSSLLLKKDFVTGFTCLHWAAKHGKSELIALIVNFARQHRVPLSIDVRSNLGYTPLHVATMQHHMEVVKLLVGAYNADVEVRDHSGRKACQYLKENVSGDIQDIIGACQSSKDQPEPLCDYGGRWKLSKVLQSNLKPLRTHHGEDSADGDQPVLRRRASFSRVRPKLQKLRNRTSQLIHSATFHGRDDLEASRKGGLRFRPKTNFFE